MLDQGWADCLDLGSCTEDSDLDAWEEREGPPLDSTPPQSVQEIGSEDKAVMELARASGGSYT